MVEESVFGLTISLEIKDPGGSIVHSHEDANFDLTDGPHTTQTTYLLPSDAILGEYIISIQLSQDDTLLHAREASFQVEDSSP